MKILDSKSHGILDYAAASALIVAPFVLGLSQLALWLSVAAGIALIVYSLITDYSVSAARLIPFRIHLALDTAAGIAFVLAPFVLGWTGITMGYYIVMGAGVLAVVALTTVPQTEVAV